jgi:hypothetical protein
MSIIIKELPKDQLKFINKRAMRSASSLAVLSLFGAVLIAVPVLIMVPSPSAGGDSKDLPGGALLAIIILSLVLYFVIAKFCMLRSILKPVANYQLKLSQEKSLFNFSSYVWRWFFTVLGLQIVIAIIVSMLASDASSGAGIVGLLATYWLANYLAITRLLKSGEATIEPIVTITVNQPTL